jgi:hydroxyacylglutathione hydrolase
MFISALPAFNDNYLWALHDGHHAAIVDPGDAAIVQAFLHVKNLTLTDILVTHHHADHIGGIAALQKAYPDVRIFGLSHSELDCVTHPVKENDHAQVLGLDFKVIQTPGHLSSHVSYVSHPLLFCGDTLFSAGCGRIFDGTPEQLFNSLNKLKALPGDTQVYCAHEYTEANLKFALHIEPGNTAVLNYMAHVKKLRAAGTPTIPTQLDIECAVNPFLRCDTIALQERLATLAGIKIDSPLAAFTCLRALKDTF